MRIQLLNAATATNGAPSLAADGFSLDRGTDLIKHDRALLLVKSTAGADTMSVTIRLWGYSAYAAQWVPLGIGDDATKGIINGGSLIGETAANSIVHSELVAGLAAFDRIYPEITQIGGTATAISAYLTAPQDHD
jgi:hypothetical protein